MTALEFKEYLPVRGELSAIGKLLLPGTRIVIPKQLRCQVLELAHEGHPGIVAMKQRLRTKVWWPGIDKEVESLEDLSWLSVSFTTNRT